MKNLRQLLLVSCVTMSITNLHGAEEKFHHRESPESYSGSVHSLSPVNNSSQKKSKIIREHSQEEKTALTEKLKSSHKLSAAVANQTEEKRNKVLTITSPAKLYSSSENVTPQISESRSSPEKIFEVLSDLENRTAAMHEKLSKFERYVDEQDAVNFQPQTSTKEEDRSDYATTEARDTKWYDSLFLEQIKNINPQSSPKELEDLKAVVSQTSMSPHNKTVFINQINTKLIESEVDEMGKRVTRIAAAVMEEEAGCDSPTNSGYESESDDQSSLSPHEINRMLTELENPTTSSDSENESVETNKAVVASHNSIVYPSTQRWMAAKDQLQESESDSESTTATVGTTTPLNPWIDTTKNTRRKNSQASPLREDKDFGISDEQDAATTERWNQRMELWNAWLKIQQQNISRYLSTWISK